MLPLVAGRPSKELAAPSVLPPAIARWLSIDLPGIDREADEAKVTPSELAAILQRAAEASADPHLGLRLPSELPLRRYDAVTLATRAASSAKEVLELLVRYAPLSFPGALATFDGTRFELRFASHPRGLGLAVDEYLLASSVAHLRSTPTRAFIQSPRPRTITAYERFGEIEFGAASTGFVVVDPERALPGDPRMLATMTDLADAALAAVPRKGAVAALVAAKIDARSTSETIADALHMSARTLQRRLEEEGTSFTSLLDSTREKLARTLLLDRALPLGEVAFRSGFSDLATFTRACKRWTGLPPGAFRRRGPC